MAKQTIIVMSDSHGDRAIVEEIKTYYLSCQVMTKCGKEFML